MYIDFNYYMKIKHVPNGRIYPFLDCWGLVCYFYKRELKIDLDNFTQFDEKTMSNALPLVKNFRKLKINESVKLGDVIAFFNKGILVHVGVFIDDNKYIHSDKRSNVVIKEYRQTHHTIIYRYDDENTNLQ